MTFDEYQKAALRTASMGLGPEIETCVRALGLCGEAAEFREAGHYGTANDEIKEAGDVMWYTAALAAAFELTGADLGIGDLASLPSAGPKAFDSYALEIVTAACKLAELTKKHIGHKKPANRAVVAALLGGVLHQLALASIMNLDGVAKANVAKLQARYPAGFDTAIASAKADSYDTAIVQSAVNDGAVLVPGTYRITETIRCPPTDANGAPVEETPGHFPEGAAHFDPESGEWKPGPV